ncbi:uncharacterized protein BDV17DRAFT_293792 [Aspergillus undulatus]|uniref:uncharacterized protein n=1 Tax=Aspergillus undulatus TaxID=1810928 RepID=UPI003CCCC73E
MRGAVYGFGSTFWKHDPDVEGSLTFDQHNLFEAAQSALQRELHAPNLWGIQACLLLLYERPPDNATIETPRTWFLEMVKLSHILHELIDSFFLDSSYQRTITQPQTREAKLLSIRRDLEIWSSMVPNCVTMAYQGNPVFRNNDAGSQLTLCGNFLIYLFLLAPTPEKVHVASELFRSFHGSLQRLREWVDDDASLALLRPVAFRIDSFFQHAAHIMRNGMGGLQNI